MLLRQAGLRNADFDPPVIALLVNSRPISGTSTIRYYSADRSTAWLLHETLPNFGVPLGLALAATLRAPEYGIALALFVVWRVVFGGADWRWPLRVMRASAKSKMVATYFSSMIARAIHPTRISRER